MVGILWLFIIPLLSAFFLIPVPLKSAPLKGFALLLSVIPLFLLLALQGNLGVIDLPWIPTLSIRFHLECDSLSLLFIYLTAFVIPASLLAVDSRALARPHAFYALVFVLQSLLFGFFSARDLALFTIFWEAVLLPLFFIVLIWGGAAGRSAAIKFILYMLFGSVLLVAGVLGLFFTASSFDFAEIAGAALSMRHAPYIAAVFFFAFAVKTPLFPLHGWLRDAYVEAPLAGTILLSAILSKAGIYGFLRLGREFFPHVLNSWGGYLLPLAIAGVLYGACVAWMQADFKTLLAYSSFSHVNFILAGIFTKSDVAYAGAVLQSLNHGITISALFLCAGWLQERVSSSPHGLCNHFPRLCWLTLFFILSSIALPGTNTFVGELMIFFGIFTGDRLAAAILGISVILSALYMLQFMQSVYFGPATEETTSYKDLSYKDLLKALPFAALILWLGIYPAPVIKQLPVVEEIRL